MKEWRHCVIDWWWTLDLPHLKFKVKNSSQWFGNTLSFVDEWNTECEMSAEGVKRLCETLKQITSLKTLYLFGFDVLFDWIVRQDWRVELNNREPDWWWRGKCHQWIAENQHIIEWPECWKFGRDWKESEKKRLDTLGNGNGQTVGLEKKERNQ